MTIKIIKEPDIHLTQAEYDALHGHYRSETRNWYGVNPPPPFESWLRTGRAVEAKSV